jgi:hypothetical protein
MTSNYSSELKIGEVPRTTSGDTDDTDAIEISALRRSMINGWPWIFQAVLVCLFIGLIAGFVQKKTYKATVRIIPPQQQAQGSGLSGGLSLLSGLAGGLGGLSPKPQPFINVQDVLHSNRLAASLLADPLLIQHMYDDKWVFRDGDWRSKNATPFFRIIVDKFYELYGITRHAGPDITNVSESLSEHISRLESKDNNIVVITALGSKPEYAVELISKAMKTADDILKQDQERKLSGRIAYLNKLLTEVSVPDYRAAVVQALSDQQKQLMDVQYEGFYSFVELDTPVRNGIPYSPKPITNVLIGLFCGLALGCTFVILRDGYRGKLSH